MSVWPLVRGTRDERVAIGAQERPQIDTRIAGHKKVARLPLPDHTPAHLPHPRIVAAHTCQYWHLL